MSVRLDPAIVPVGCFDGGIDLFESQYAVPGGVSYNSYVILDEKTAVLDTVDPRKTDDWLANLDGALGAAPRITWSFTTWSRTTRAASPPWRTNFPA